MFELNFRDERYLPFEGAGVISEWKIELTQDVDLRQFDYNTIADVILHSSYTAREDAGLFKTNAVTYLKNFLTTAADTQPLMRMFSMKHEFSTEWHQFLHPLVANADQTLSITLRKEHFPFFAKDRGIMVKKIEVLMKANRSGDYEMVFNGTDLDNNEMNPAYQLTSPPSPPPTEIAMPENITYANMQKATIDATTPNANVEILNVFKQMTLKFRHTSDLGIPPEQLPNDPQRYNQIDPNPEEISDVFVVFHYALG